MSESYPPPVDRLLTLGEDAARTHPWPDYPEEHGLRPEHVPALIAMATDADLLWADGDATEVWAPVHAWRALGQLRAEAAVQPLVELLPEMEESDWVLEDFPVVFGMIGRAAIPALAAHLADTGNGLWTRINTAHGLAKIAGADPGARDEAVAALVRPLEKWYRNDVIINSFLITYLVDLRATEAAPLMERAFAEGRVDVTVRGDWEDVQVDLGLLPERRTPRPRLYPLLDAFPSAPPPPARPRREARRKAKDKRKAARRSRKRNRRK